MNVEAKRVEIRKRIVDIFHTSPEEAKDISHRIESVASQMMVDISNVINFDNTMVALMTNTELNTSTLELMMQALERIETTHKCMVELVAYLSPIVMLKAYCGHLNIDIESGDK